MEHILQWLWLISIHMEHHKVNGVGVAPSPPLPRRRTVKSQTHWEDRSLTLKKKSCIFMSVRRKKARAAQAGSYSPTDDGADDDRPDIPEVVVQVWEQLKGAGGDFLFFIREKSIIKRCHWFFIPRSRSSLSCLRYFSLAIDNSKGLQIHSVHQNRWSESNQWFTSYHFLLHFPTNFLLLPVYNKMKINPLSSKKWKHK